ncbi:TIR domain-containing protein [Rhodococcus pyridinivorans]|uniref:TIR domain-containing protein n=1 Tax=Rhodococcus pyridinivorans TaxID=103816 RepID=UPI001C303E42|nr:TIR domain-containing protein [Rhodococcus pyridinivorans]QXF82084.1 TIR domain-containing protein [Rhodococcus pyridinivorans]
MTLTPSAFWSYAHVDDDATDGHVRRLATQVKNAFRLLTGTELELFFDRESLQWGDEWKDKIDNSVHGTTFFIPIITPSYLKSSACREEFLLFWKKSSTSGLGELLLPIIYAPITFDMESDDEIVATVSKIQSEIWQEIRLEDESSSAYKKALNKLAARLKEIADSVEQKPEVAFPASPPNTPENRDPACPDEDEPGLLEQVAEIESMLPEWQATVEDMGVAMSEIGTATEAATPGLEKAKKTGKMAPRIVALKNAARLLDAPTVKFLDSAKSYHDKSSEMDQGIIALAQIAELSNDAAERQSALELAEGIQGIHNTVEKIMSDFQETLQTIKDVGKLSRDMREPTLRISNGFRIIQDTQFIFENWIKILEEVGNPSE